MRAPPRGYRMARGTLIRVGLFLLALALGVIAATCVLLIWPSTDMPRGADGIVVFGGAHEDRVELGIRLAERGLAPTLIITGAPDGASVCGRRARFEIVCLDPEPFNTRGDARVASKLAASRGWSSLLLVTSTYHVTRARALLDRCFAGDVEVVAAKPHTSLFRDAEVLLHEWGGLVYAYTVGRGC
jgi:uncharacterized SAM-binding protein YcdF (DUF218 family)